MNVTISGFHALVAAEEGVYALDISVPATPLLRSSHMMHGTKGIPADMAVGNGILVTDFDGGLRVLSPGPLYSYASFLPLVDR